MHFKMATLLFLFLLLVAAAAGVPLLLFEWLSFAVLAMAHINYGHIFKGHRIAESPCTHGSFCSTTPASHSARSRRSAFMPRSWSCKAIGA